MEALQALTYMFFVGIPLIIFVGIPLKTLELGIRGSIFAGKKILSLFSNKENNDIKNENVINNTNKIESDNANAISDEDIAKIDIEEKKILKIVENLDKKIKENNNNQKKSY